MEASTYGRNRQSIADLEQELYAIFQEHPQSSLGDNDEPVIPADALVDVLRTFSGKHDAVDLMSKEEEDQLAQLIESNPGLAVTPTVLLQFIAMRTTVSPRHSPEGSPPPSMEEFVERGRSDFRDEDFEFEGHSRSSSRDSVGTSVYRSRPPSRGPSVPPSPFDASRRQRSTPLNNGTAQPPSSWSRRPPPSRRKSDAGSHSRALSDSESSTSSQYAHTPGRTRAPSNPTTPMHSNYVSPVHSPEYGGSYSRPHSRAQSQPQSQFASLSTLDTSGGDYSYGSSPERDHDRTGLLSPPPSDQSESSFDEEQFMGRISSLPMPRSSDSDSDSDSDREDSTLGLVMDRSAASSTVSMDNQERLDALQRINTDLARKLVEAERTLQNRLADHEQELEEMQGRLDEARSELSSTKREEKELRSKERQNSTQISALESEIAKLQKSLDTARSSYQSLQKQYQEQCSESERYRNELRQKDQSIKDLDDAAALQALEVQKLLREQQNYEERIAFIESELSIAQQAQAQLDEQKQENMMLKETIDRMRFDMDEMRHSAHSNGASGTSSAHGTVNKSLGAELLSKMSSGQWDADEEVEEGNSSATLQINSDDDTEDEDVVETIITRTKRKVASRAKGFETMKVEEIKEYSDTATQYDTLEFALDSSTQTEPEPKVLTASFSVQTDELSISAMSIQTEAESERPLMVTMDAGIQTEDLDDDSSISSTPQTLNEDEEDTPASLASSSSTLVPPTPKPKNEALPHTHDLPPAYAQVTSQDQDELALRVANETLRKWHKGLKLPIEAVQGGISEDAIEDWKALKEELGVECMAIDRLVEESSRTSQPRSKERQARRRSRFYNIYNTYVYGGGDPDSGSFFSNNLVICLSALALAFCAGHAMSPSNSVPGGATYYDRAAWSSFNSMHPSGEGFSSDGTAVWDIIGRLGGGAARNLRGWPT